MPDRTIKTDQAAFMEMLHSVSEIVKNLEQPLSKTELMEYFKNMELSAEQQDPIYQYFQKDVSDTLQPGGQELVSLAETGKKAAENKKKRPESAFFQMYLKDLQSIMPCTVQEEERLYAKLAAGDETAVRKLSEQWMLRTLPLAEQYDTGRQYGDISLPAGYAWLWPNHEFSKRAGKCGSNSDESLPGRGNGSQNHG